MLVLWRYDQTRGARVPRMRYAPHDVQRGRGGTRTMERANNRAVGRHQHRNDRAGSFPDDLLRSGQEFGGGRAADGTSILAL